MTRAVSIGLDGAAWHALDPMIEAGELPNLARLVRRGTRAPLESVTPPVTCPAWRCSTSGKNPGKLGVYWWLTMDRETGELTTPDARSFETADIWDYLTEAGDSSAILNLPMTYPPESLDGVMVAGFGAPFDLDVSEPITHPPELQERIRTGYDWEIGVDDVTAPGGVDAAYDLIDSRFALFHDLLDSGRFDYLHLTIFYINVLQHKFGDGPETRRAWRRIDDHLGAIPDDVLTVIFSDHGHSAIENTFVINRYLADQGYLTMGAEDGDSLGQRLYSGMKAAGISPRDAATTARSVLPARVYDWLTPSYPVPTGAIAERVDWTASSAMAVSQGPIFLNRDRLGADYERVKAALAAELESLSHRGEPVFEAVLDREAVYSGPNVGVAPDLLAIPARGWEIYGGLTPDTFETQVTSWTSGNHPEGVLLLHGPAVTSGELGTRSLLDVMPTILRYLGHRVPTDVDGAAVRDPFAEGALADGFREPIDAGADGGSGDAGSVRRRLEGLGYLE